MTERHLEDLENRIDSEVEDQLQAKWEAFTQGRFEGGIFSPRRTKQAPPGIEWPEVSVNLSQPHLNEMEVIYRNTVDMGIKLLGFAREHAEETLAAGRSLHGCVHCW